MDRLRFCTAGIPTSVEKGTTLDGLREVKRLDLDGMELEFVHSVNLSSAAAKEVKDLAKKLQLSLTCHAQYYINLFSLEAAKVRASIQRILNAARRANEAGAWSVCFHAAYYMKHEPSVVYSAVRDRLCDIARVLQEESNPIWIRPETTGKQSQFGTVREICRLSQEIEQVQPCVDFAHIHARSHGRINSSEEFRRILSTIERALGRKALREMHIHLSGIAYGEKGERHHLSLKESDFRYRDLLGVFREYGVKGCVVSESPIVEKDALLLKKEYNRIS